MDTISAISTLLGESAINIVRLSGNKAIKIGELIFKSKRRKKNISHLMQYGHIIGLKNEVIDEVLVSFMKAPYTYTKEDMVEIFCHGGVISTQKVLELTLRKGARLAEPGEFTKRAFLNGRIDLTQAEAVVEIIRAKTDYALKIAQQQLQGNLRNTINNLCEILIDLLTDIEAAIDFPEEKLEVIQQNKIEEKINYLIHKIENLITNFKVSQVLKEGITLAIIGKPNVGKSTLLNTLLKEERAIVTPIPGTTRDIIKETIILKGILINIIDTAGIRKPENIVEEEGVKKTFEYISLADLLLLVIDLSSSFTEEDKELLDKVNGKPTLVVLNKKDLPLKLDLNKVNLNSLPFIKISALHQEGIKELEKKIIEFLNNYKFTIFPKMIINIRHKKTLIKAKEYLKKAKKNLFPSFSYELVAIDLKDALFSLEEIIGKKVSEDLLERIFSKFCIGK